MIDPRTRPQKQHDALATALGIAARHDEMPSLGGAAPTLVVHVDAKDLVAGAVAGAGPGFGTVAGVFASCVATAVGTGVGLGSSARTSVTGDVPSLFRTGAAGLGTGADGFATGHDDHPTRPDGASAWPLNGWATIPGIDTPVAASVAAHTACTGTIQRVLFDEGRIIGIGVTDRVFTVHQRRAIVLRDKECLIPGCHVPASWCEIHHVVEWARGGPTHTDNGVPLCWHHHRTLDTSGWEIRMVGGIPQIRGPGWWDPTQRWRTPRPTLDTLVHA